MKIVINCQIVENCQKEHVSDCDATTKHAQTDESTRKFTQFSDIFQVQNLLIPQSLLTL